VPPGPVRAARKAAAKLPTMQQQSGAIRKAVPWELVAATLWPVKDLRRSPAGSPIRCVL
jgi:hypothetical protein